jgi:CMP-N-acetylneuraminic acid synthetase
MNIALIPLRKGSKSIKNKNIKELNGKPLCYYVIKACLDSKIFSNVFVSTDSTEYANIAKEIGAEIHIRGAESATDEAPTSLVIDDFLNSYPSTSSITIVQATSPLTQSIHLAEAFKLYQQNNASSVISCINTHQFRWSNDNPSKPLNFNPSDRKRRQDCKGDLIEDGAFYILRIEEYKKIKSIPCGDNIVTYKMPFNNKFEIDEPIDFEIMEFLIKNN